MYNKLPQTYIQNPQNPKTPLFGNDYNALNYYKPSKSANKRIFGSFSTLIRYI